MFPKLGKEELCCRLTVSHNDMWTEFVTNNEAENVVSKWKSYSFK